MEEFSQNMICFSSKFIVIPGGYPSLDPKELSIEIKKA